MASPPARRPIRAPAEQPLLPDEILEVIFLRLDSGYDIARASATCRAFRRVATDRLFLRRFLSLHPPPVVGFFGSEAIRGLKPADPPHQSAPAARALAQAGDYKFSFLPNDSRPNNNWILCDVRDGRFLLSRKATDASTFLELVVSDPLYRRYVQIPPIPGDLVPHITSIGVMKSEPFLAPAEENGLGVDSRFRVIYNLLSRSNYMVVSFVFSAVTGEWCCATSFSSTLIRHRPTFQRYYARGCFYWVHPWDKYMVMLDPCEMKFSVILHDKNLSRHRASFKRLQVRGLAIMAAAEDRLGLLTLDGAMLDLYTKTCQNNGVEKEEWRHDKFIRLPRPYYNYSIIGAAEGYLLLIGFLCTEICLSPAEQKVQYFVVNLETFVVERLCELNGSMYHGHLYASFPPPLSLPSL